MRLSRIGHPATIDLDEITRVIARGVAHEIDRDAFEIFWRAEARNGRALPDLLSERRVRASILDRLRGGVARTHGVAADGVAPHLDCDPTRQCGERRLFHAVNL